MSVTPEAPETLNDTQVRLIVAGIEWATGLSFARWFAQKRAAMPDGVFMAAPCGCVFQIESEARTYRVMRVIRSEKCYGR